MRSILLLPKRGSRIVSSRAYTPFAYLERSVGGFDFSRGQRRLLSTASKIAVPQPSNHMQKLTATEVQGKGFAACMRSKPAPMCPCDMLFAALAGSSLTLPWVTKLVLQDGGCAPIARKRAE